MPTPGEIRPDGGGDRRPVEVGRRSPLAVGDRIFREYLHETPHRHLTNLRMRKARELLLSRESLSIKEITARVGYSDALNFFTEFRKRFKLSPREYRRIEH